MSAFFDTNVACYALGRGDPRQNRALDLLFRGGAISVQVLNELASVLRNKLQMSWKETGLAIEQLLILCPRACPLTLETHQTAMRVCARYGLAIYDGLIVASAMEAGCDTLYTEDMHHGQTIEGVRIVNPFL